MHLVQGRIFLTLYIKDITIFEISLSKYSGLICLTVGALLLYLTNVSNLLSLSG